MDNIVVFGIVLFGTSALVAALLNALKTFGILADGGAAKLGAAFSVLVFAGLSLAKIYNPELDLLVIDEQARKIAEALVYLIGLAVQLGLPQRFHEWYVRAGLPLIGMSYSEKKWEELA